MPGSGDRERAADERDRTSAAHDENAEARDARSDARDARAEARDKAQPTADPHAASDRAGAKRDPDELVVHGDLTLPTAERLREYAVFIG